MKKIFIISLIFCFCLSSLTLNATVLYPGRTTNISFEPTTGEYGPHWTTGNPTLQLTSTGFTCNITAKAYFSGTATVTCTYKDRIGNSVYERKRSWDYTCIDTQISISPTSKSLKLKESFQFSYSFNRTTYITPSIQFTGYDMDVVNITSNGLVTAKSVGETKIYVKSNIGTNSVICTVKVSDSNNDTSSASNSDYYNWDSSKTMTITLEEGGTLCDYITDDNKYTITDLTIIGPLNGSDLRLLRDMAGINHNNSYTNGKLETLDLKESFFVSGGPWYVNTWGEYQYTSDGFSPYYAFTWCNKLKKIRLPKYYKNIPIGTTLQCYRLEKLSIPPGVTTIYKDNLSGGWNEATSRPNPLSMQTLLLPSTINCIYFDDVCDNLTDIYCYASVPPELEYSSSSFSNITNCSNGTLYVPKGSAQAYWKAEGWREFKNIKETLEVCNALKFYVGENGSVIFNNEIIEKKYNNFLTGYQVFDIPTTQDVIISVTPKDGYSLSRITMADETIEIPQNTKILNLGKISKPTTINIEFEETSSVKDIVVNTDSNVEYYTIDGLKVDSSNIMKGLYIKKQGNKITKVVL